MTDEEKRELNRAIETLKYLCRTTDCNVCPMAKYNCYGDQRWHCEIPDVWETID